MNKPSLTFIPPTGSSDIEAQNHKHGRRHFLDFKPHFRLNEDQYDVIAALLKTMEKCTTKKMKNEGKLLARFLKFCRLIDFFNKISFLFKFCCHDK